MISERWIKTVCVVWLDVKAKFCSNKQVVIINWFCLRNYAFLFPKEITNIHLKMRMYFLKEKNSASSLSGIYSIILLFNLKIQKWKHDMNYSFDATLIYLLNGHDNSNLARCVFKVQIYSYIKRDFSRKLLIWRSMNWWWRLPALNCIYHESQ